MHTQKASSLKTLAYLYCNKLADRATVLVADYSSCIQYREAQTFYTRHSGRSAKYVVHL